MILRRLVAFPESKRILTYHVLAAPFIAVQLGIVAMVPVLLRRHFAANELQMVLATSSSTLLSMLAIFWNEAYRRLSTRRYLLVLCMVSAAPLAAAGMFKGTWFVLLFVLISAAGQGGIYSVIGDVLRGCYPPATRNRIFSVLKVLEQATIMVSTFGIGLWLDYSDRAYRIFFPAGAILIGVGLFLLSRITHQPLFQERLRPEAKPDEPILKSLLGAYRSMSGALRRDANFRRYETAFCIYGLGWNICNALVPFVAVDILHLRYGQVGFATQAACQLTLILMLFPASLLTDRLGPIRMSAWSFALLLLWPVGLMLARNVTDLTIVTILYGVGITGVNLTWTVGPVKLAHNAAQASQYLSIHATLVAVRAVFGQFPAVYLYYRFHQVWPSLIAAALLFVVGSVLMIRLERDCRMGEPVAVPQAEPELVGAN